MLKRIFKVTLIVSASCLIFISFLPMLVSISQVNQCLLSFVNKRIAGKLNAQEIRVGWTDGISIKGLEIQDPQGRKVALFKKISCDVALLSLIHAPAIEGKIEVDSPKITLIDDSNTGHFSIEEAFGSPENTPQEPLQKNEFTISDMHIAIDIQPQGQAKVNLTCQVENKDEKGSLNVNATAQNFADLSKAYKNAIGQDLQAAASVVSLDCYIDQFPISASLPFVNMVNPALAKLIIPAVGNKLNAKISHTLRGDELGVTMLLNSPELTTKLRASIKGNTLTIPDEGTIQWNIKPDVIKALQTAYPTLLPFAIEQEKATTLHATLNPYSGTLGIDGKMPIDLTWNLESPLTVKSASWPTPLTFNMQGQISALALQESIEAKVNASIATGKEVSTLEALCTINHPLEQPETNCKTRLNGPLANQIARFIKEPLPLTSLLGKTTSVEAISNISDQETSCELQMHSDAANINLAATLEDNVLKVKPSSIYCKVSPEVIAFFIPQEKNITTTEIPVQLTVSSLEFPLNKPIKMTALDASLTIEPFSVQGSKNIDVAKTVVLLEKAKGANLVATSVESGPYKALVDVQLPETEKDPITGTLAIKPLGEFAIQAPFSIKLAEKEVSGKVAVTSATTNLECRYLAKQTPVSDYSMLPALSLQLDGEMNAFPTALIADFIKKPELTTLLGKTLSGSWKLGFDNTLASQPLVIKLAGEGVSVETNLQLAKEITSATNRDGAIIEWQITPERLQALQSMLSLAQSEKQKEMKLAKNATLHAHIKGINIPLEQLVQEGKPLVLGRFLDALFLDAKASLDEISLTTKADKKLSIAALQFALQATGKERKVAFSCKNDSTSHKDSALISIMGTATNLWNDEGIQVDQARIVMDTRIQNLPLDIFHTVATKEDTAEKLVAVLGHNLNASFKGEIKHLNEGTFSGNINSPRLKSDVSCELKEGMLTLNKPITAEYTLTPEAGEVLLKDINPLLVTAAKTKDPIKLSIDSKDFAIPLKPFSKETMKMKNIKIEPGILTCKNGGMLKLLVSLLKVNTASSDEVTLWFTPIYIEVQDGIVHCRRSDALLANDFPIATWGKIDLMKNKIDMTLGLSGRAIAKGFDIPKLDPNYMVQIPIHGQTQSPKIDSGLATTKITALKLQQHRGNTTSLIGGLLEVATTIVEKDAPVPAPTTHPFPWAR